MELTLNDFTASQLKLLQDGISQQIAENNIHIEILENMFEYTLLSQNTEYIMRIQLNDDLWQCATKLIEAILVKKMEAIVTCN